MRVLLIDADNFNASAWIDEAFRKLESIEGTFAVRRAYGSAENLKGLSDSLRKWVMRPFANLPLTKNTTDLSLAVDAMELACQTPRPSLIVIGSGDADFVPLVVRLRERGIKVVCVSEMSKMANEAVPSYDHVIYVGAEVPRKISKASASTAEKPAAATKAPAPSAAKKTTAKAPAPKITHTPVPAKKAPAKKVPKKVALATGDAVSLANILSVMPALKSGDWQPLGEVAKALHDEKLLGKNAASTKLFKKFAQHFELMPAGKPNRVRYITSAQ